MPVVSVVVSESASVSMEVLIRVGDELFPVSVLTPTRDVGFTSSAE